MLHRLRWGKSGFILTPLWTGKSSKIINPPVSKASFKRRAKSHKKKERCASITIICGRCDSCCQPLFVIPCFIWRVLGADAPEHSLLVNTSLRFNSTPGRTRVFLFFHRRQRVLQYDQGGSNSVYCQDLFKAPSRKHLIKALSEMLASARNPMNNFKCPPITNFKLQSMTERSKRRPITTPYLSSLRPSIVLLRSDTVVTIRVSIVVVCYTPSD